MKRWSLFVLLAITGLPPVAAPQGPATPVARRTGTFKDARLKESSGVVASRLRPGLLWTLNDSGNDPVLFLTDTSGAALGSLTLRGASNVDWEALGRGPCGSQVCLVIGDTGDNAERRASVRLYRIVEPQSFPKAGAAAALRLETLSVAYPNGPHDVEALYVEPDGAVMLVTKGRRGGIRTFRVPASAWGAGRGVTAAPVDSLPIAASARTGRLVTDAAISPDAAWVAVRTYRDVYFFRRDEAGRLQPDRSRPACDIAGREPQGEGIDWWDRHTLVLTSERGTFTAGIITLLHCPGL